MAQAPGEECGSMMQAAELAVLDWLQAHLRCDFLDAVMPWISRICDHGEIWILLAAVLLLLRKHRWTGMSLSFALILDLICCNIVLKPLVGRIRPFLVNTAVELLTAPPADASFPSGHTAASFAAVFALRASGSPLWKPALVLAAGIAFSRLYLYVHWPTDVLGGILVGAAFEKSSLTLREGDRLVLVSDGVTATGADWVKSQLEAGAELSAQQLAEDLARTARERQQPGREDDITVLVADLFRAD